MKLRFDSKVFDYFEDVGIGIFYRVFSVVLYWLGKDLIYSEIKENKELIVAADGWYKKLTHLISTYFNSNGLKINLSVMSTKTRCLCVW